MSRIQWECTVWAMVPQRVLHEAATKWVMGPGRQGTLQAGVMKYQLFKASFSLQGGKWTLVLSLHYGSNPNVTGYYALGFFLFVLITFFFFFLIIFMFVFLLLVTHIPLVRLFIMFFICILVYELIQEHKYIYGKYRYNKYVLSFMHNVTYCRLIICVQSVWKEQKVLLRIAIKWNMTGKHWL